MIQKSLLLFALCFVSQLSWGQQGPLKEANKAFKANGFYAAIADYKTIENPKDQTLLNLADNYYYVSKKNKAVDVYEKNNTVDISLNQDALLRFADAEKATDKYDQSNAILPKYAGKPVNIRKEIVESAEDLPLLFDLQILDKDSEYAAFGPSLFQDKLVFASDINKNRPIYSRTQQPYLDLYSATVNGNTLTDVTLFSEAINTPLHEGNATFTKDGKTMYFTRTNDKYKRINGVKIAVLQLYKADFTNGEWKNIRKLQLNDDYYSMAHPALSGDDKALYFTSDMPGGYGQGDIYKIDILSDNSYGDPVNLGASVNSDMQEQFPYISNKGNLYFASDRFMGLGGLDVYRSNSINGAFAEAYNLGETVNSEYDDFSLLIDAQQETGYLSSNRGGTDKIYRFTAMDNRKHQLTGVLTNVETQDPLSQVTVALYKEDIKVTEILTDAQGQYNFSLESNSSYRVEAASQNFQPATRNLIIDRKSKVQLAMDLALQPVKKTLAERNLDNIYFGFDKWGISTEAQKTMDKLVEFMKENQKIKIAIASHTDAVGTSSYNKKLSQKRANATKNYLIAQGITTDRLSTTAQGEEHLLVDTSLSSQQKAGKNRRSEFRIIEN